MTSTHQIAQDRTLRDLVRAPLRSVVTYDPGPSVAELEARYGVRGLVKLNWNEDLFGLLPGVEAAVAEEMSRASLYPEQAYSDFREEVAAYSGTDSSLVLPAHGIQALVMSVIAAFVNPGERVVLPAPTYGLYRQACEAAGATVVRVPTKELRLDLEKMVEAAQGSKLVVVCDPNNPTGDWLRPHEWQAFAGALPTGCLALVDEAYADYLDAAERPNRLFDIAAGRAVVVLRTFSKLFGIAGLRLGYALLSPELVPCLDAVQEPFNVNRLALAAGRACLADVAAVERRRKQVAEARTFFVERLAASGIASVPSRANFVLVEPGGDDLAISEHLVRAGFLVRAGSEFGLRGHLRITVGPEDLMARVADALVTARDATSATT